MSVFVALCRDFVFQSVALPPGRNGFQPQLNLVYSTGNGNGTFGLGWSLSIPGVNRQTSKGIPRYDDAKGTFVLSGAEDLVPVKRQPELIRYQPRTEGLFARILHHRDAAVKNPTLFGLGSFGRGLIPRDGCRY